MANVKKNDENLSSGRFKVLEWVIKLKEKHGWMNIIMSCVMLVFMSVTLNLAINPSIIFDKYREYEELKHAQSFEYRMKSGRAINLIMNEILRETNAKRCFVIEMHNGKSNATGLSFNYGSMTYEVKNDSAESIMEDYAEFSLDRYPFIMYVVDNEHWIGNIESLANIDKKLALKMEANGATSMAIVMIYGIKSEIGFLGITYDGKIDGMNKTRLLMDMTKYAGQISPYLDGERVN